MPDPPPVEPHSSTYARQSEHSRTYSCQADSSRKLDYPPDACKYVRMRVCRWGWSSGGAAVSLTCFPQFVHVDVDQMSSLLVETEIRYISHPCSEWSTRTDVSLLTIGGAYL
ncbi:hypothetical protein ABW21_db0207522 [Orbilia brochopaga]|nr:hypothetical protein ABW21_db0207522 [Drechslerella brochopaga]